MSDYILLLIPAGGDIPPAELELYPAGDPRTDFQRGESEGPYVCGDAAYGGKLLGGKAGRVEAVRAFYCNDYDPLRITAVPEEDGVRIDFPDGGMIFRDLFGYVRFTLALQEKDGGGTQTLHTAWVPIYVSRTDQSARQACASMARMADYVFEHCAPFWQEEQVPDEALDRTPSMALGGLKAFGRQSLESQIQLLEDLIRTYERTLPFFRTAAKYRVRPEKQWINFERATHLSADTVHSILRQPCHLMPSGQGGVRIPDREGRYIPAKVVAAAGKVNCDIYENRYVVGFLRYLMDWLAGMSEELEKRLEALPDVGEKAGDRQNSACFLLGSTPQRLREDERRLKDIGGRIFQIYAAYHQLLPNVKTDQVRGVPRPTAIFRTVHHYRGIYELACQWFQFGAYDFRREDILLPFVEGHKLYEYYVLIRMLHRLTQEKGLEVSARKMARWDDGGRLTVSGEGRPNVFSLRKEDWSVTVFYEPRIYGYDFGENLPELELFCISSYGFDGERKDARGRHYYKPDYVVKLQDGDAPAGYVILDAKFSDWFVTQHYHMPKLVFKYRCGLALVHPKRDTLLGLALLYGKPGRDERRTVLEICDQAGDDPAQWPFVRLIVLRPDNEEDHDKALSAALPF